MNEIDLYVSLIDEQEANRILKFFNQSIKTGTLEFKRTKIKTIFRGKLPTKKKNSFGQNPFWVILQSHQIEKYKNYEEKKFLLELNSKNDNIPYYVKLANLIIKFHDKIDEYMKLISNNINLSKDPFDFGIELNEESEIIDYFNSRSYINNNKLFLEFINKYYDIAVKNEFILPIKKLEIEIIKKYSLKDLYTRLNRESINSSIMIKYEYINSHTEMNEQLFKSFSVDVITGLAKIFYDHKNYYGDKDEIIESLKNELRIVQENEKKLNKKYSNYEKKYHKELELRDEELKIILNEVDVLKSKLVDFNKLDEQIIELKDSNKKLERQLKEEKKKNKEYERNIKETQLYYEYAFDLEESNIEKKIGIIHSMEYIKIAKVIFNEVEFISLKSWKDKIKKLKIVYIQREGIQTRELEEIKTFCLQNDIINRVISIDNEKTLIQKISLIKEGMERS